MTAPPADAPDTHTARCGARKKRGGLCQAWPERGRTRCRLHGGRSLSGIAHPNWKHGMYDGSLPSGLAKHYRVARENPELVKLTEQIALVDAKTYELLEQLAAGESPGAWARLLDLTREQHTAFHAFHAATQAKDTAAAMGALKRLEALIGDGVALARSSAGASAGWDAITQQISLRKKLVDSEVKRASQAHEMVTKDKALGMLGFIAASIARHVTDAKQKQAVVEDMRRLMAAPAGTAMRAQVS